MFGATPARRAKSSMRLGIDIGGTFTDMVLVGRAGRVAFGKSLTTHGDLAGGTVDAAVRFLDQHDVTPSEIGEIVHGTTLGSNVVLERKGWPTALLTTEGFRDVLIIQRQRRHDLYDLSVGKPEPLVPRSLVFEVPERVTADGDILRRVDREAVAAIAEALTKGGIRAAAICLLHSYRNPMNERETARILGELAPDIFVSVSSEITQRIREYERASTTVMNAYIAGQVRGYLVGLEESLRLLGFRGALHVMQSNGGVAPVATIARLPVRILESGPAAGALAAARTGVLARRPESISFDMGGTTAKVGLIQNGSPGYTQDFEVDRLTLKPGSGLPVDVATVDLVEIGAGGGSIASGLGGLLSVGPHSAGSEPGPACYGRGGHRATVTDANLVLGYLSADNFLGGAIQLDVAAARRSIEHHVARPLGLSVEDAAWGVHELATESMASVARVVCVDRGNDPREFSMIAFGGAGPAHAVGMARRLGVATVIVPLGAGVASAIGLLSCDTRFEVSRTSVLRIESAAGPSAEALFSELQLGLSQMFAESGGVTDGMIVTRSVAMRYAGQGYELEVALGAAELDATALSGAVAQFHDRYRQVYGYSDPGRPVDGVEWRLSGVAVRPKLDFPPVEDREPTGAAAHRPVYLGSSHGFVECPVYDRAGLSPRDAIVGPAIIEERECTSVLLPGTSTSVDRRGNLVVSVEAGRSLHAVPAEKERARV
jgi:N-methylhydantoinase A